MTLSKNQFVCSECSALSTQWMGQCPRCKSWNSLSEKKQSEPQKNQQFEHRIKTQVLSLSSIKKESNTKIVTGLTELDRVLGGGLTHGSLTLLGGEPGVGKSTLLLKICEQVANQLTSLPENKIVLYVTGEELVHQVAERAERMFIQNNRIHIIHETNLQLIKDVVSDFRPVLLIIDSIQTTVSSEVAGSAGSVSQVKEVTFEIMNLIKSLEITTIIIGHINKEGSIAGPKVLEHMVDTVLSFEREQNYRILRASKNRFGSTTELGVFEMNNSGIEDSRIIAQNFLKYDNKNLIGRSFTCSYQGNRHLFLEVQALVVESSLAAGKIISQGVESKRISLIVAVLEKFLKLGLSAHDIYINIAGEIRLDSKASDLALVSAILSSFYNTPTVDRSLYVGEIGLAGEIRPAKMGSAFLTELSSIGIKKLICAKGVEDTDNKVSRNGSLEVITVANINDLKESHIKKLFAICS